MPSQEPLSLSRRLSSVAIWNTNVALVGILVFSFLSYTYDCVRQNSYSPGWIAVNAADCVAMMALPFACVRICRRFGVTSFKNFWPNLLIAGASGSLHSLATDFLSPWTHLSANVTIGFHIVSGSLVGAVIIYFSAAMSNALANRRLRMSSIIETRQKLAQYRRSIRTNLQLESDKLMAEARQTLLPRIDSVRADLAAKKAAAEIVNTLEKLLFDELRPMNDEIANRASSLEMNLQPLTNKVPKAAFFPKNVSLKNVLNPLFISLLVVLQQGASLYPFMGWELVLLAPIATAGTFGLLVLANRLMPPKVKVSTFTALALYCAVVIVAITPVAALDALTLSRPEWVFPALAATYITIILLGLYSVYVHATHDEQIEIEQKLREKNQEFAAQISLYEQKLWLVRRRWLTVLHGTVQASITAALARISSNPELSNQVIELVAQDLQRATLALNTPQFKPMDFNKALRELSDTWQGICQIEAVNSTQAEQLVLANEDAKTCTNELIKEAVSNAIRHGRATKVWIKMNIERPGVINLTVENNGAPPVETGRKSVGSRLFDELTISWQRGYSQNDQLTYVRALFAVS